MSFIFGHVVKKAAEFEQAAAKIAATLSIPLDEAKERLRNEMQDAVRRSVLPVEDWTIDLTPFVRSVRFGDDRPANPADRRTVRLAGKPKHYVQVDGRLRLRDGESPWS